MSIHKNIIQKYINTYAADIPQYDKELLFRILSNPESTLSGDFFELYNQQAALQLVDDILAKKNIADFEVKMKKICNLPYNREQKNFLQMTYGTQRCQFATMEDIQFLIKDFPGYTGDITANKPQNYHDHLQLTNPELINRLLDNNDPAHDRLMKEWNEYMLYRLFFMELIGPLRRTIGIEPFIALVKKGFIEDELDEYYIKLYDMFNSHNWLLEDNTIDIDYIRHYINKIEVYTKRDRKHKLQKEEEKLGAPRMATMLDILYLKEQLKQQSKIVKKYFNNSNIDATIIDFFERNYAEQWEKIKNFAYLLQKKEIFLWAYFNGVLQMK